jgi:cathepsin D
MIPATLLSLLSLGLVPLIASNPTPSRREEPAHFPISRRSTKPRGVDGLARAANHLRQKYSYPPVEGKRKRAGNTGAVSITNQVCHSFPGILDIQITISKR